MAQVRAASADTTGDLRLDAHADLSNVVDLLDRSPGLTALELHARLALAAFITHLERASPESRLENERLQALAALASLSDFLRASHR